ncbi:tetratricopeptide repeat protein [Moorena sp. SIO3H5]|uniref:tetratricopeptide repeat protein n=1 Tax=Moorena sp. SIO3H5 TaxID=2607834 RepID=UPI0013BE747A|nr:tetratricopeptide repeat protein [Moorena sp. SIO3H5]NEO73731.1 tetratricopeptide repeat protein [Moorena sp. SIO3H5]
MYTYLTDAITACEQALESPSPNGADFASTCRVLGNILQGMGRFDDAIFWHSRVFDDKPNLVQVYAKFGSLYTSQQQWQQAIASYYHAIRLQPDFAEAYWSLAEIYSQLGNKDEEIECWYQTLNLKPQSAKAQGHYKLGTAFLGQGKPDRAIACFQNAIERDSSLWAAYYELGDCLIAQGKWENAIACYRQLLDLDPNQAKGHYKIAGIWLKQGMVDTAIAAFRRSIEVDPNFPGAYRELIQLLIQQQKWDEAIVSCRAVIATVGDYPWTYVKLGDTLVKKGEFTEAYSCYQKAAQLRGWDQCAQKDYRFTEDKFTFKIPVWEKHLQPLAGVADAQCLEIGSFQGNSACWLLDKILTNPSARLTCVSPYFQEEFAANIAKTGAAEKVTRLEGKPEQLLNSIDSNCYDLANIRDRRQKATIAEQNALLCWKLLKVGGLMIVNNYGWSNPAKPQEAPKIGINRFLDSVKGQFEILHQDRVLIVKKIAS